MPAGCDITPLLAARAANVKRPLQEESTLHNARTPYKEIYQEKPWHRQAGEMALSGATVDAIAATLGKSESQVKLILKQSWARGYMESEAKKRSACDEIREILEEVGPASLKRIVALAEKNAGTALGFDADKELLNRLLGKPTQPIREEEKPAQELEFDELQRRVSGIVGGVQPPGEPPDESNRVG